MGGITNYKWQKQFEEQWGILHNRYGKRDLLARTVQQLHVIHWQWIADTSVMAKQVLILSAVWRSDAVQSLPRSISARG